MLIILPDYCKTLANVEESLDKFDFTKIDSLLDMNKKVSLVMPKFRIENTLDLVDPLKKVYDDDVIVVMHEEY